MEPQTLLRDESELSEEKVPWLHSSWSIKRSGIIGLLAILSVAGLSLSAHSTAPIELVNTDHTQTKYELVNAIVELMRDGAEITQQMTNELKKNMIQVANEADNARREIRNWVDQASQINDAKLHKLTRDFVSAHVQLTQLEQDFKGWIYTQTALYKLQLRIISKKLSETKGKVDVAANKKLLGKTLDKAVIAVEQMKKKAGSLQVKYSDLAVRARIQQGRVVADKEKVNGELRSAARKLKQQQLTLQETRKKLCVKKAWAGRGGIWGFLSFGISLIVADMKARACNKIKLPLDPNNPLHGLMELKRQALRTFDRAKNFFRQIEIKSRFMASKAQKDYETMTQVQGKLNAASASLDVLTPDRDMTEAFVDASLKPLIDCLVDVGKKLKIDDW